MLKRLKKTFLSGVDYTRYSVPLCDCERRASVALLYSVVLMKRRAGE